MQLEFEFTMDELIDAKMRSVKRKKTFRTGQYLSAAIAAIINGAIVLSIGALFGFTWFLYVLAIITALIGGIIGFQAHEGGVKKRYIKPMQELMRGADKLLFQLELREYGIWTKQGEIETIFDWLSIKEIVETNNSIDFFMNNNGFIVIRKRAFATKTEERLFVNALTEHLHYLSDINHQ